MRFLAILLAVFTVPEPTPERWLDVFPAYPGAHRICAQHVSGRANDKRVEISFTTYGTLDAPADVVRFYAKADGRTSGADRDSIELTRNDGHKLLDVHTVAGALPQCDGKPAATDRTLIVVSERTP